MALPSHSIRVPEEIERAGRPGGLRQRNRKKLLVSMPGKARVPIPGSGTGPIEQTFCWVGYQATVSSLNEILSSRAHDENLS
jgi:hypothetical protein